MGNSGQSEIDVLHVDDEPEMLEITKYQLEKETDEITVHSEADPDSALSHLESDQFDCIISDYNMPDTHGIEFLETVREEYPDLPFILFTGKGSEEIASEAISAGVTDYLQKQVGEDQYTVLANRIGNSVAQYRAEQEVVETRKYFSTILEYSSDFVMIVDDMGSVDYVSPSVERVMGYTPESLYDTNAFEFTHPEDLDKALEALADVIEQENIEHTVEFRAKTASGDWIWLEVRGRSLLDDPIIEGVMVNCRDITERKLREQDLEQQKERLMNLTRFMSHDLRHHLHIIKMRINMVEDEIENDHLELANQNIDRIDQMIDDVMILAKSDELELDTIVLDFRDVVNGCWNNIYQEGATVELRSEGKIVADEGHLKRLLENLLLNAVEHGGEGITISVGRTDEGFYIADDGDGLPEESQDELFQSGFSTGNGSGFGLAIVEEIATAHGWDITVTDSDKGGARFEFTNVDFRE